MLRDSTSMKFKGSRGAISLQGEGVEETVLESWAALNLGPGCGRMGVNVSV